MQDLVGRIQLIDPEASNTLRVVSYFDSLIAAGGATGALIRAAANLSGVTVGFRSSMTAARAGADGRALPFPPDFAIDVAWPSQEFGTNAIAWLERTSEHHANDAIILERLAIGLTLRTATPSSGSSAAVETAVSSVATWPERRAALSTLSLLDRPALRIAALPAHGSVPGKFPSAVVAGPYGLALCAIVGPARHSFDSSGARVGLGEVVEPDALPQSWSTAAVALRLTNRDSPSIDAADLGVLLRALQSDQSSGKPVADVVTLGSLNADELRLLDAVSDGLSARSIAARMNMHHSTVQARISHLSDSLAFDPRSSVGRARYTVARLMQRLEHPSPTGD